MEAEEGAEITSTLAPLVCRSPETIPRTNAIANDINCYRRNFGDLRDNAEYLLKYSNACPFRIKRRSFYCAYCSFTTQIFASLVSHVDKHKAKNDLIINLGAESLWKADVTNLHCILCKTNMATLSTLLDHLLIDHNKAVKRRLSLGVVPFLLRDGYKCADCGEKFEQIKDLNGHMSKHYPYFVCSVCEQGFTNEARLETHSSAHRNATPKCSQCDKTFTNMYHRRKHMAEEHNIFAHRCPYCRETFRDYRQRVAHMNEVHEKNINFPCPFCSKVFILSSNRKKHVKIVHERQVPEKKFVCVVCGKLFVYISDLNNHMICHGGERIYKCEVCGKAYARKKTLREHMRIHNNDKRFVCKCCGKAFVQNSCLKSHMKIHQPRLE